MKVAITSQGNTHESTLDSRFGRCSFFAIYDSETQATEFIENPHKESNEGAGPAAAQFVITKGVQKIVSGEFGGKAKSVLEALNIQMIEIKDTEITIGNVLENILKH